jgi:hypothetical protein
VYLVRRAPWAPTEGLSVPMRDLFDTPGPVPGAGPRRLVEPLSSGGDDRRSRHMFDVFPLPSRGPTELSLAWAGAKIPKR